MPASNMSRISNMPHSNTAATMAREVARQQIAQRMKSGQLRGQSEVEKEFFSIYNQEYYRFYAHLLHQEKTRIVDNPSAHKYFDQHIAIGMNKVNCFLRADTNRITVYRISFPIDNDVDTCEAHLGVWPGPLDKADEYLKRRLTEYLDTLWQHEPQRTLRYLIGNHDEHRKVILRLLTELLHRNGFIDAPGITRLLLSPGLTEIQKDEVDVIETLQKYLLLGKRSEAIKFAKSKKLWDHAQCLAFLHKYQPPATSNYIRDEPRLSDDPLVQLNDEYINSIHRHDMLKIVYKSLLNRILQSDPSSHDAIKRHDVKNGDYEFALLCANDCEMDFDQSNETFKLIMAIKSATLNQSATNNHLISLGYTVLEATEPSDDLSYRSNPSFKFGDSIFQDCASKIQALSNIDMLILNEIWEYCLNLARGTCNPDNYSYNMNLIPYKLIFAWRLLEYGLHSMFPYYLDSIKRALIKTKSQQYTETDSPYDWANIEHCVESLSRVWHIFDISYNGTNTSSPTSGSSYPNFGSHHQPSASGNSWSTMDAVRQNGLMATANLPHLRGSVDLPTSSSLHNPTGIPHPKSMFDLNIAQAPAHAEYQQPHQPAPPAGLNTQRYHPTSSLIPAPASGAYGRATDMSNPFNETEQQQTVSTSSLDRDIANPQMLGSAKHLQPELVKHEAPTSRPHQHQQSNHFDVTSDYSPTPPQPMTTSSPMNREPESIQSPMGESFNSPFSPINELDDLSRRGSARHNSMTSSSHNFARGDSNVGSTAGRNIQNSANNNDTKPTQESGNQQQQQQQSKFPSITSFVGSLLPKSNSKPMILPDDTEKTFKYDDNKKAWVDTTQADGGEASDPYSEPPPMMNAIKPPASYSFANKTSTRSRYPQP